MDTPWKRLEAVIKHYGFRSTSSFAKHIGLSRAENLYRIKKGKNGISHGLAATINRYFPDISCGWLIIGEGHMLPETHCP
jgi:hypothetical protein